MAARQLSPLPNHDSPNSSPEVEIIGNNNSPPPPPPPPWPRRAPITSTYIASGTEGCIVGPALPNLSENGSRWEEYPDYVTKLYTMPDKYNKAIEDSIKIKGLLKNNSHNVYPYRFQGYKGSNIPTTIKQKQANGTFKNVSTITKCGVGADNSLQPLRMKNLGVSILHLSKNAGGSLGKTKAVPFGIILDNIYRIYKQIEHLFINGYIHGDVRDTNIMIHPNTGKITLIDFGWLYPMKEFFEGYFDSLGFYSNPPESLFYTYIRDGVYYINTIFLHYMLDPSIKNIIIPNIIKNVFPGFKSAFDKISNYIKYSNMAKNPIDGAKLLLALQSAGMYFKRTINVSSPRNYNNEFKQYYEAMAPSFDLYGLSFTIHLLIQSVYDDLTTITKAGVPYTEEEISLIRSTIEELVQSVIKPSLELNITQRIPIQEACARLEVIVSSYHDRLLSLTGGRRRKTHKRRRGGKKTLRRK